MGRKPLLQHQTVVNAINHWIAEQGIPPTLQELKRVLKVGSTRTVLRYLRLLEADGEIERWPGARGIRPLKSSIKGVETVLVPIIGEVPAGALATAEQSAEGWVSLPRTIAKSKRTKYFLLRVRGNSMNRASLEGKLIENGDLVLVGQQAHADSGNIVVALIDGQVTIKRLVRGPDYWLLKPESSEPEYTPILVDNEFMVEGVASAVIKKGSDLLDYNHD